MEEEEKKTIDNNKETDGGKSSSSVFKRADAKGYVDPSARKKKQQFENDKLKNKKNSNNRPFGGSKFDFVNEEVDEQEDSVDDSFLVSQIVEKREKSVSPSIGGGFSLFGKAKRRFMLICLIGAFFFIFFMLIIAVLTGKNPVGAVSIGSDTEENEIIKELKSKISEVKSKYSSKYHVTIDEKLILATLIAYQDAEKYTIDAQNETETIVEEDEDGNTISRDVSAMTSKIELLAKYQIMTTAKCNYDSSTIRKIASNDKKNLFNEEEKNYKCNSDSDGESYSLSVDRGDISDNNSGGVYYWNLIDEDFITDYYADYIEEDNSSKEKNIASIVDEIYDYYEVLPDADEEGGVCGVVYAECPGVKVTGYGTYDLETYVAGVLFAEFGSLSDSEEMMKAASIAIRSFVLGSTNNCSSSISSSESSQIFEENSSVVKYAQETAGLVLTSENKIITAPYSALDQNDCDSVYMENGVKTCKVRNETWFGSGKFYDITVPYSFLPDDVGGYHHTGMAVWAMYYYAKVQGYDSEKLLKMSYGEDITIAKLSSSASNGGALCGSGDMSTSYWWPIGSKETEIIAGKEFARGTPQSVQLTSPFGCGSENNWRTTKCHSGQDIGNAGNGPGVVNVIAAKGGLVIYPTSKADTHYSDNGYYGNTEGGGLGNYVIIQHDDGVYTWYGHMAKDSIVVMAGDTVTQGQVIGKMGNSGSSLGTHLHLTVTVGGLSAENRVDPLKYVDPNNPRPQ